MKEDVSIITDNLQSISVDIDDLKSRVTLLEVRSDDDEHYTHGLQADMAATEDRLKDTMTELDEKMDRLEAYSRRQNLKFFEIPMSDNDNRTGSVQKVLQALPTAMPGKNWSEDHTVRAHRLGSDDQNLQNQQNGQGRREKPMIVRFTRWHDKMDFLTDCRWGLC